MRCSMSECLQEAAPFPLLEKSDSVLWALTADGIVLHNIDRDVFVELRGIQHSIWSYLDGAHTLDCLVEVLQEQAQSEGVDLPPLIRGVAADLLAGGFLVRTLK